MTCFHDKRCHVWGNVHPANTFPTSLGALEELPYRYGHFFRKKFMENGQKISSKWLNVVVFSLLPPKLPKKSNFWSFYMNVFTKKVSVATQ